MACVDGWDCAQASPVWPGCRVSTGRWSAATTTQLSFKVTSASEAWSEPLCGSHFTGMKQSELWQTLPPLCSGTRGDRGSPAVSSEPSKGGRCVATQPDFDASALNKVPH